MPERRSAAAGATRSSARAAGSSASSPSRDRSASRVTVEGEIAAQDTLTIGESAVVNAQIVGNAVVIQGRVTGDVTARKRLEIRAPGKLFGNITTPSLVIHEGVVFEGQCNMGADDPQRAEKDRKVTPSFPARRARPSRFTPRVREVARRALDSSPDPDPSDTCWNSNYSLARPDRPVRARSGSC